MKEWILVANASTAFLYGSENLRTQELQLIKELKHPESREKGSDLSSDRPGHYMTDHTARSAYQHANPRDVEAEVFARELVAEIKSGFDDHHYEQLILVAAPHFYGLLNKHMNFNVAALIHIPKDYTKLTARELLPQLRKQLFE